MAISEPYELDGVSISTSEISLISGTTTLQTATTAGIYYPWLDPVGAAMAKGDKFDFKVYEKVRSSGTKRQAMTASLAHAQASVVAYPGLLLINGFDFTLDKIAGTDRNWDASVRAVTGSAITEAYTFSASVSTTELSITGGTSSIQTITTDGFYQLWIDGIGASMAKGDEFEIRVLEKVEGTGGTQREVFSQRITDVQTHLWFSPIFCLINGWDMTIKKIAGTDRTIEASIRKAA